MQLRNKSYMKYCKNILLKKQLQKKETQNMYQN